MTILYFNVLGANIDISSRVENIDIATPFNVSIGANCWIQSNVLIDYHGIKTDSKCFSISNNTFIGYDCKFNLIEGIQIGSFCMISAGCKFIDHDHGLNIGKKMKFQPAISQPILIGTDVWLGSNVVVLKGVTIGEGAVVAAGSVVTKSIPSFEIWGGIPAKFIKKRQ
jgi:acetyltransferase-like isoleucine patch superfamily enzyme